MSILLLGNGINLQEKLAPSWGELLQEIAKVYGCTSEDSLSNTLGYEMFENRILKGNDGEKELTIHRKIANGVETEELKHKNDWSGTIHAKLLSLPVKTILTTNYDYALERAAETGFKHKQNTKETIYSLRRYQDAGGKRFFHIHGECGYPRSICLGFEQYAGSLQNIRQSIVQSTSSEGDGHTYLLADIMNGITEKPAESWVYDFFTENVYILGFGMDVSEMDLWWLLSYRSKQITSNRLPITNRIVYLDIGFDDAEDKQPDCDRTKCKYRTEANEQKKRARGQRKKLLETFDVEYRMCRGKTYDDQYADALRYLSKEMR